MTDSEALISVHDLLTAVSAGATSGVSALVGDLVSSGGKRATAGLSRSVSKLHSALRPRLGTEGLAALEQFTQNPTPENQHTLQGHIESVGAHRDEHVQAATREVLAVINDSTFHQQTGDRHVHMHAEGESTAAAIDSISNSTVHFGPKHNYSGDNPDPQ